MAVGTGGGDEEGLHPPALMNRTVIEEPGVGAEDVGMLLEQHRKVRGARLLLTLEDALDVDGRLDPSGVQGIGGGEQGEDRAFVITARAGVERPLRAEGRVAASPA